jgi:glycosyltransferase involved in cell wall biosynthesis
VNIGLSNKHGILHRLYTFLAYAIVACWYAVVLPADVVISSSGPITVGLPALVSKYLRRRPFVFEVRDLWPQGAIEMGFLTNPLLIWVARLFERLCYAAAAKVVVLSEGMGEWISETYLLSNTEVVPNAADTELFQRLQKEPSTLALPSRDKQIVVYAGNMGPGDDCGQLLDMAKCLRHDPRAKNVEVVLIGDGKQGASLRKRAQDENIPVRFLGFIPREQLIPILNHAQCAVFATKNLRFYNTCSPNKLFDAFAAGLPVVQTTHGWIKNLLEREHCGFTVPENDPASFAEAVLRVLGNYQLSSSLGANAQRVAREQFDRELLSAKMLELVLAAALKHKGLPQTAMQSAVPRP